jgi:enterochelin esterase-like enzyme
MRLSRRSFLGAAAVTTLARGEDAVAPVARDLVVRDVTEPRAKGVARRFVLLLPTHLRPNDHVPLVVLLHGLAETVDPRMGAYAWLERYGLGRAYDRLRRPPIERTSARKDWTDARLAEVNAELAARPFRGMALVCPYMPPNPGVSLDALAEWIVGDVVPHAQVDAPVVPDPAKTAIGGCSLGGYAGLEVFLRRPEAFSAFAGVQSAIGEAAAPGYADRLARALVKAGPRKILLESSSLDPYRAANERLAAELTVRKTAAELRVPPGPHDQPWLRETGTIEMLLWLDRALS